VKDGVKAGTMRKRRPVSRAENHETRADDKGSLAARLPLIRNHPL